MPSMANITVKKNDGTTDVIYTAVQPSAGDKSPAVWQNQTIGTAVSHRPEFRVWSADNGAGTARRVNYSFVYPSVATGSDGRINVVDKSSGSGSFALAKGQPVADTNEAAAQFGNLLASALMKAMNQTGYAAG